MIAYLGESSNLSLLLHQLYGAASAVHYPVTDGVTQSKLRHADEVEMGILHQRGAFLLPSRALCDELIESYFTWVAPIIPIINRSQFMRQYRDPKDSPSLLLMQALLLASTRVSTSADITDENGTTMPTAKTFYTRAKALLDAKYEDDQITIVQALVLIGWYWEGPQGMGPAEFWEFINLNHRRSDEKRVLLDWSCYLYGTGVRSASKASTSVCFAKAELNPYSVERSQMSKPNKRLWKRIWWTLFTRDRSVAAALTLPLHINTDDSDVEPISEDDFIENDEVDHPAEYQPNLIHVQFFLQYVKLCEIMGRALCQVHSPASKRSKTEFVDLIHHDTALAHWLQSCPHELNWQRSRHHFWSALLHLNY